MTVAESDCATGMSSSPPLIAHIATTTIVTRTRTVRTRLVTRDDGLGYDKFLPGSDGDQCNPGSDGDNDRRHI